MCNPKSETRTTTAWIRLTCFEDYGPEKRRNMGHQQLVCQPHRKSLCKLRESKAEKAETGSKEKARQENGKGRRERHKQRQIQKASAELNFCHLHPNES
jgi:hypothetical protein